MIRWLRKLFAPKYVYVVEMYRRYQERNSSQHHYVLGVFYDSEIAALGGRTEVLWKENKYYFCIVKYEINNIDDGPIQWDWMED